MMQRFIRFVLSRVDVAIVLGDRLRKLFSPEVPQIKVVPNGIDFPVHQQRVSAAKKVICVSYLGGLFRAKGILDLIEAASIVLKKHRSVCFEFAGEWWDQEPDTKQNVMEILKTGAITSQVDFKGKLTGSAKEEFLLNADMIVLPSWNEGLPIVILEAMAASAPVISTKVGAIPEVVVDNVTGILVDKQDPPQLADAIIRLIEYPDLRRAMGEAGRKRYLEFFTFEKCANRMIDVFHAAISHDESFQNGIAKQAVSSERPLAERSVA
jgi:glycosyltransferase involved in cell wall biosynthesis